MSETADAPMFGSRKGWSLRRRFTALDSYGLLLLLILGTLLVSVLSVSTLDTVIGELRTLALVGTLAFALHTSNASRPTYVACVVLAVVAIVSGLSVDAASRLGEAVASLSSFLLIAAVLLTVLRRFTTHQVITGSSILAALSIYLFVGLAFSTVYGFIAAIDVGPLFAGSAGDGTSAERVYYSFITLTTTGYGDFVPLADVARMVAVTEALLGQVYLVTIVALLVSNVGGSRRPRGARD
jgi:hypothetical protein